MVAEAREKAGIRDQKKEKRFQSMHWIPKSAIGIKFLIICLQSPDQTYN